VGKLYEGKLKIEHIIKEKRLDSVLTKGLISLEVGFLLNLIRQDTPDDAMKIEKLSKAVKKILNETLL